MEAFFQPTRIWLPGRPSFLSPLPLQISPVNYATQSPSLSSTPRSASVVTTTAFLAAYAALRSRRRLGSSLQAVATATTLDIASEVSAAKVDFLKKLFSETLEAQAPRKLETFLAVVQGSGFSILAQDEWKSIGGDLHPFLLPIAIKGNFDKELEVMALMIRGPNGVKLSPDQYQVVTQKPRKSKYVQLIATDVNRYIMKRAEEAHFQKEKEDLPIIEATADVYQVRFTGQDRTALDKWLLLEVGPFADVYKHLALEKLEQGDAKSGLVIADTMRETFGTAWAFPHAFVSYVLRKYFDGKGQLEDRSVEAGFCAMQCFTSGYPLWSLEDFSDAQDASADLFDLLCEAKIPKISNLDSLRVFYLKRVTDDQRAAVRSGNISLGCAAMAKGQALMDAVCCGHKSYNGIRQELIEIYEEVPGCEALIELINYFKQPQA